MRRGFTLIEVLVVLGITVLLIAIAIPALWGARKRSEQVQCGNNLKQVMAGVMNYALESRQAMMFSNSAGLESGTNPKWAGAGWLYDWKLVDGAGRDRTSFLGSDSREGVLWHYVQESRKTYFCPSTKMSEEDESGEAEVMTSYMMNSAVTGLGLKVLPFRIDRFEAKHVAFWEPKEGSGGNWNDGNIEPVNGRTTRHVEGVNVACFDGHVEFWANLTFDKEAYPPDGTPAANPNQPPVSSRLWCDPRDPAKGWFNP